MTSHSSKLDVLIAGGGVAALETALALNELVPERVAMTLLAPDPELVYRPMTVQEPFSYSAARRYLLAPIAGDIGATLLADKLERVDVDRNTAHTASGQELHYDALVLALGAHALPRFRHAITIDDRHMDETLHGLIQDIEGGYVDSVAFVSPGRMAWPMPIYELALMMKGRAYDMGIDLATTIVTPEDSPLAVFGLTASDAVAELLARAGIETVTSAYAEIPAAGEIVIAPGDRRLHAKRIIALPELYGPPLQGVPLSEHGFIRADSHGRVPGAPRIFAAGDAVDFPIKQGGIGSQQADAVAQSIAALAGAELTPEPFEPVLRGVLLTGQKPLYLNAKLTGGHGSSSLASDTQTWSPASKIAAKYLAPYLEQLDNEAAPQ